MQACTCLFFASVICRRDKATVKLEEEGIDEEDDEACAA